MTITAKRHNVRLSIYIDGILHIRLKPKTVLALQSWHDGANEFCIEIVLVDAQLLLEYVSRDIWERVLELLGENL